MPCYAVYGLTLTSPLLFPELLPGLGRVDVFIDVSQVKSAVFHEHSPILCAAVSPSRVHLTWGGVGDLLIEDSQRITVIAGPNTDEDALRLFILGAGLGVLLHQRGLLVIHASGVIIEDRVVGFIGAKGWGKSTTAATLHQRGHTLISDELLVVRFDDQGYPWVIPGSPQIKLWEDALVSTGGDPNSAVRVRSGVDKFHVNAASIAPNELPLHGLYLLDGGEELSVRSMSPSEAFLGVVPHLYVCRFGTSFLQETGMAHAFEQVSRLLRVVNVKRLLRRRDLSQLSDIARLIERDVLHDMESAKS